MSDAIFVANAKIRGQFGLTNGQWSTVLQHMPRIVAQDGTWFHVSLPVSYINGLQSFVERKGCDLTPKTARDYNATPEARQSVSRAREQLATKLGGKNRWSFHAVAKLFDMRAPDVRNWMIMGRIDSLTPGVLFADVGKIRKFFKWEPPMR